MGLLRRALRCVSLSASLAVLGASLGGASAARASSGPEYFGTNVQTLGWMAPDARPRALDFLAQNRMAVNRVDVHWADVEPNAPSVKATGQAACAGHAYTWTMVDQWITRLASRGLRAAPVFRFAPAWAQVPGDELPPAVYDDFGCMVAAFAQRYGDPPGPGVGTFWQANPTLPLRAVQTFELWNEANLNEYAWNQRADPELYAAMLKVAAPIVRAAMPGAIVLGDLSYKDDVPDYVLRLGAAGGLAAIDAMGFHPYAPDAETTIALVERLRQQLSTAGFPAMPIYANEAGQEAVVTYADGTRTPDRAPAQFAHDLFPSDNARAANLAFAGEALAASDCGVEQFLPYSIAGSERDGEKRTEAWMGLFRPSTGEPNLTALAVGRASQRWASRFDAGGPGVPPRLALCGGGVTDDNAKLVIDSTFTVPRAGCIQLTASYDGNPLESVTLRLTSPSGAVVAIARTDALGVASACIPYGVPKQGWTARGDLDAAGRTGTIRCDVTTVGCPAGASYTPGSGTISAAAASGVPQPVAPSCTWRTRTRVLAFSPSKGLRDAQARLRLFVECDTAPKNERVRFAVFAATSPKGKALRKIKTVWLRNGAGREVLLRGRFSNGHRLVVQHRPQPGSSVPSLRDVVTLRATAPKKRR